MLKHKPLRRKHKLNYFEKFKVQISEFRYSVDNYNVFTIYLRGCCGERKSCGKGAEPAVTGCGWGQGLRGWSGHVDSTVSNVPMPPPPHPNTKTLQNVCMN